MNELFQQQDIVSAMLLYSASENKGTIDICKIRYASLIYLNQVLTRKQYNVVMDYVVQEQIKLLVKKRKTDKINVGILDHNIGCMGDISNLLTNAGMNVCSIPVSFYDFNGYKNESFSFEETPEYEIPDIMFYRTPYTASGMAGNKEKHLLPLSCLTILLPYGYLVPRGDISIGGFNSPYVKMASKIICFDASIAKFFSCVCHAEESRLIRSGYPKTDPFFDELPIHKSNKKRVIYAPGLLAGIHNIPSFDKNYQLMFDIARSYETEIDWDFRPHPLLWHELFARGIMSKEEWEVYLEKWENLEGGCVSRGGDYIDEFNQSDAMIMDSASFLGVYQYTHKPLCMLSRKEQRLCSTGERLRDVVYTAECTNVKQIKSFIDEVVLKGNDYMLEAREKLFTQDLDYYSNNGKLASEYIADYIIDMVSGN